jgi:hypothetical protein
MRDGALYGGASAGALGIAGEGLIAARRLLPETDLTPIAARRAKATAVQEVSRAVDDSGELVEAARSRARRIREEAVAAQPELRVELDKIALQKAKDLADAQTASARARQMKAEADAAAASSRADAAAARAERAKNPPKRGKKAKGETEATGESPLAQDAAGAAAEVVTPSQVPSGLNAAIPEVPQTPDDMIRKLMDTKNALNNGSTLSDLSARQKETLVEDALNQHVAKFNPDMERLLRHLDGLSDARTQVAGWLDRYGANSKVKGFEYAEGMRRQSGYAEVVPQGEGNVLKPRGREFELRGGPDAALASRPRSSAATCIASSMIRWPVPRRKPLLQRRSRWKAMRALRPSPTFNPSAAPTASTASIPRPPRKKSSAHPKNNSPTARPSTTTWSAR